MSPKDFSQNKISTILANSYGVKNTLDIAKKYNSKLIHFSSSVVYGPRRKDNKRISEEDLGMVDALSERSSYDEGKRFAETMVKNFSDVYGLDAKIIRLFRTYGPRMKLNDNQMIPDFIDNALSDKDLTVFGDQNFSSSFCYVSDVIDAVFKLIETDLTGPYNVGSDVDMPVGQVADKIIQLIESKSSVVYEKEVEFMSQLPLPDISKVVNDLGWMPVVTLEEGLKKTINDLRASKGLKTVKNINF
jgi:nucleoside-diphosphate-sugar epimerase